MCLMWLQEKSARQNFGKLPENSRARRHPDDEDFDVFCVILSLSATLCASIDFFFTIHCRVSLKMNCEMKKKIYIYEKYHRLLFSKHPAGFPVYQTSSWHLICPNETHVTEVCCWEKWREIIHSKHLYILYLRLHIFHHRLLRDRLIQLVDKNNCYKNPCIFNLLFATPAKILGFSFVPQLKFSCVPSTYLKPHGKKKGNYEMRGVCTDWERLHWGMGALRDIGKGRFPELHAWELSVGTLLLSAGFRETRLEAQIIVLKVNRLKYGTFKKWFAAIFDFKNGCSKDEIMTDVDEGLGLVSCMSPQLDHGWVSLRHTKQMGEGRETTNRSYRMRGAKRKALRKKIWNLHSNTCITLKHLAEGRRDRKSFGAETLAAWAAGGKKKEIPNCDHAV